MNLIDEIEAAAKRWDATLPQAYDCDEWHAQGIVESPQWPRIKAALEAAQEMDQSLMGKAGVPRDTMSAQRRFREANGS